MTRTAYSRQIFRTWLYSSAISGTLALCLLLMAGCGSNYNIGSGANSPMSGSGLPDSAAAPENDHYQTQPTAEPPAANQPEAGSNAAANNPYAAAGIDDPEAFEAIFDQIKSAVAGGDKDKVADYVLFPMRLNTAKANTIIKNKEDFINKYDAILTAPVKKALANQKIDSLFVNDQGVMVGNGEMWFGATAGSPQKYGIIAVNHDTVGTD